MAHQRCCEARADGKGRRSLMQPCEPDWLIAEGRQNFLMTQQASAVAFKNKHRLPYPTNPNGRMLDKYRLTGWDRWKPDLKARSNSRSALHLHGTIMFPDDITGCREPKTVAVGAGAKERYD